MKFRIFLISLYEITMPDQCEIEYEDYDIIETIEKSKNIEKEHPPDITNDDDIITSISFSPSDDIIAVGSIEGDIYLYRYNNEETELLHKYSAHMGNCRKIEYDDDGELLYSVSDDKCIIVADPNTGKFKNVYDNAHIGPIYSLLIINENLFTTGDDQGIIKLWDRRKRKEIFSSKVSEEHVSSLHCIERNGTVVGLTGEGILAALNINTRKLVKSEPYHAEFTCGGLFYSNTKLVVGTTIGSLLVYSWGQFTEWNDEYPGIDKKKYAINCMVPITENIVITGLDNGDIRATNLFPMKHIGVVGQRDASVESLDISKDGTIIASSSLNNTINFWNVQYFEDICVTKSKKQDCKYLKNYNLPSSKELNASDFFAGLG